MPNLVRNSYVVEMCRTNRTHWFRRFTDYERSNTRNDREFQYKAKTVRHRDAVSALSCYQSIYMASEEPRSPCDFSYTRELSFLTSFAGHIGCYNDGPARFNIHCTAKEHASTDVPLQFPLLLCARHRA